MESGRHSLMRILWFSWRDIKNPEAGGAEVFAYEVARRLVESGNVVTLFTSAYPGCRREEEIDGIRVIRDGGRYSVYWRARGHYSASLSKEGFDLVVDEINTVPFFAPKFVKGERIIAMIHQLAREYWFYETPFPINQIGYHLLEERWLRNYAKIPTITVSESTKRDLVNLGFKYIHVVTEGLNFNPPKEIPEKEGHPVVVYVGRLKRAKRPDHAIKAFKMVKERLPDAELWMIGDGNFRWQLEGMVKMGVRFFGHLPNRERRELLKRTWVMVNPGIREGYGLNVIEANALGVPCVAYDVPGLRDSVKDGGTGFLVRSGDVLALSESILKILENYSLRMELSSRSLEYARGFNWDRTSHEVLGVMTQIVGSG
jgi:glycosyltransferase involved in cell wall biosynthesis